MDAAAVDRPNQVLRHNPKTASTADWKLTTWTTGTAYSPGEPIDIGLHLKFTGQDLKQKPKATVRLNLEHVDDPVKLHRELTVPFKELKGKVSEWEAIMVDVFNTDSHRDEATVLREGEYLLGMEILIDGVVVLGPLSSLIKIDNVDGKNLIDYYREHYPNDTKHNVVSSSVGDWNLTTWTTGSTYPPGAPIVLGLHLTFSGQGSQPIPKAVLRLSLKNASGSTALNRELTIPFKKVNSNEWEAIMGDVFKTDSHRAGATILKEGDYHVDYTLQIGKNTVIPGKTFPIELLYYRR